MDHRIEFLEQKTLVGKSLTMSFANNRTGELWKSFMPRRKDIPHAMGNELYSLQIYPAAFFQPFNPHQTFEKWATVEVSAIESLPGGMESFTLPAGLYAVFTYVGSDAKAAEAFGYIFSQWLPKSDYALDNRPHFEKLGEKYKRDDPSSEEEIWMPIAPKAKS